MDYKTSGVDIEAGREFVSEIKKAVEGTHTSNVIEALAVSEACLEFLSIVLKNQFLFQELMVLEQN